MFIYFMISEVVWHCCDSDPLWCIISLQMSIREEQSVVIRVRKIGGRDADDCGVGMWALETTENVSHAPLVPSPANNMEFGSGPVVLVRQSVPSLDYLRAAPKSKAASVRLPSWEVIPGSQEWGPREVKADWQGGKRGINQTHRASCDISQRMK